MREIVKINKEKLWVLGISTAPPPASSTLSSSNRTTHIDLFARGSRSGSLFFVPRFVPRCPGERRGIPALGSIPG